MFKVGIRRVSKDGSVTNISLTEGHDYIHGGQQTFKTSIKRVRDTRKVDTEQTVKKTINDKGRMVVNTPTPKPAAPIVKIPTVVTEVIEDPYNHLLTTLEAMKSVVIPMNVSMVRDDMLTEYRENVQSSFFNKWEPDEQGKFYIQNAYQMIEYAVPILADRFNLNRVAVKKVLLEELKENYNDYEITEPGKEQEEVKAEAAPKQDTPAPEPTVVNDKYDDLAAKYGYDENASSKPAPYAKKNRLNDF